MTEICLSAFCRFIGKKECKSSLSVFNFILDINKCATEEHSCSNDAVCHNTEGSHDCTCKPGYTGDGRNCSGDVFSLFAPCLCLLCYYYAVTGSLSTGTEFFNRMLLLNNRTTNKRTTGCNNDVIHLSPGRPKRDRVWNSLKINGTGETWIQLIYKIARSYENLLFFTIFRYSLRIL